MASEGPTPSSPQPDAQTQASASKLSRIIQGVSFIRTVAENVQQHSPPAKNKNATRPEFPEWMQELLEPAAEKRKRRKRIQPNKWLQRSSAFQGLTQWAFDMCDARGDGRINSDELYAGILLVHLHLAKYVGVTACTPLNRTEVDELFKLAAAADPLSTLLDRQTIGPDAFGDIVLLSCAKISSRIVVYYALLVVLVPFLTRRIIGLWQQGVRQISVGVRYLWGSAHHHGATATHSQIAATASAWRHHVWALAEWTVQHLLTMVVVTVVVPWIFVRFNQMAPKWLRPKPRFWR